MDHKNKRAASDAVYEAPLDPLLCAGVLALIVEDDEDLCALVSHFLSDAGLEVVSVHSAEEAMKVYRERCPSLIVTDLKLPGMSGHELVRAIRSDNPATPHSDHERDQLGGTGRSAHQLRCR